MLPKSFFCIAFLVGGVNANKPYLEDALRKTLAQDYDPQSKPQAKVEVTVRFTLLHFLMNEDKQSLDLDIWGSMEWEDQRLNWDKSQYPNIPNLPMLPNQVWHPDISLYNSVQGSTIPWDKSLHVVVMPSGKVLWVPTGRVKAACVMDMRRWPYDMHNCTAKFGSWVHSAESIDLNPKDDEFNFEEIAMNTDELNLTRTEWRVLESQVDRVSKKYDCCVEEYVSIRARLLIQRVAPVFAWIVQMPVVVLGLITITVFLIPPSAGEKVILAVVSLVLHFMFLFAVSKAIGSPVTHTPYIVELIGNQLIMSAVAVMISALLLRLVRDPHAGGLPKAVMAPIAILSTGLCLGGYRRLASTVIAPISRKAEEMELNEGAGVKGRGLLASDVKGGTEGDWLLLAVVLDRLCLIVFAIVFLKNMIAYSDVL